MELSPHFVDSPPKYPGEPAYWDACPPSYYAVQSHSGRCVGYNPPYNRNQVVPYPFTYPTPHLPPQQTQPQQQQQQQSVVIVNADNPAPIIVQEARDVSYAGYQTLACLVLWFFNCLFGCIAWILAGELLYSNKVGCMLGEEV